MLQAVSGRAIAQEARQLEGDERTLYPTLAVAFDAHRRRTLHQDCDDEESSYSRSAERSASRRTTINPSHPPSSSPSAIAIPTAAAAAALSEAAPQSIHVAASSTNSHSFRNGSEASSTTLKHPSDSVLLVLCRPQTSRGIEKRWMRSAVIVSAVGERQQTSCTVESS